MSDLEWSASSEAITLAGKYENWFGSRLFDLAAVHAERQGSKDRFGFAAIEEKHIRRAVEELLGRLPSNVESGR